MWPHCSDLKKAKMTIVSKSRKVQPTHPKWPVQEESWCFHPLLLPHSNWTLKDPGSRLRLAVHTLRYRNKQKHKRSKQTKETNKKIEQSSTQIGATNKKTNKQTNIHRITNFYAVVWTLMPFRHAWLNRCRFLTSVFWSLQVTECWGKSSQWKWKCQYKVSIPKVSVEKKKSHSKFSFLLEDRSQLLRDGFGILLSWLGPHSPPAALQLPAHLLRALKLQALPVLGRRALLIALSTSSLPAAIDRSQRSGQPWSHFFDPDTSPVSHSLTQLLQ